MLTFSLLALEFRSETVLYSISRTNMLISYLIFFKVSRHSFLLRM